MSERVTKHTKKIKKIRPPPPPLKMTKLTLYSPFVRAGHNVVLTAVVISVSIAKAGGLSPQIPPVDTAPAVPPAAQVGGFACCPLTARHGRNGVGSIRLV